MISFILITPQSLGLKAIPNITWGSFQGRDHFGVDLGITSGWGSFRGLYSTCVLHSLLNKIWIVEGIPQSWKLGLLVIPPKKGDLGDCKNWRGIMFLTIASKVLRKFTLLRMKDSLEKRLKDEQAGLCMKCPCCDHITTLKVIVEQTLEWNTGLYMVFVDFEKAFHFINRDMLWKILCYDGVPSKTIKMIRFFTRVFMQE